MIKRSFPSSRAAIPTRMRSVASTWQSPSEGPAPGPSETGRREALRILAVCTANQCRSPMFEFLVRSAVQERGLNWSVGSCGTRAATGVHMHPNTDRYLRSQGLQLEGWRTRRLTDDLLDSSHLILTATRQHRSAILEARPDLLDRTFPILQFASLAEACRASGLWRPEEQLDPEALVAAVRAVRGATQVAANRLDLGDPVGRPYRRFQHCGKTLAQAISQMLGD